MVVIIYVRTIADDLELKSSTGLSLVLEDVKNLSTSLENFKTLSGITFETIQKQLEERFKYVQKELDRRDEELAKREAKRDEELAKREEPMHSFNRVCALVEAAEKHMFQELESDRVRMKREREIVDKQLDLREQQLTVIEASVKNWLSEVGAMTSQAHGQRHGQGRGGQGQGDRASTASRTLRSSKK